MTFTFNDINLINLGYIVLRVNNVASLYLFDLFFCFLVFVVDTWIFTPNQF